MIWQEFIWSHTEVLAAVDFFTTEVWTGGGLIICYVLTFMRLAPRLVCRGYYLSRLRMDAANAAEYEVCTKLCTKGGEGAVEVQ